MLFYSFMLDEYGHGQLCSRFNVMGTSFDVMLKNLLLSHSAKVPLVLGQKINELERLVLGKRIIDNLSVISRLRDFNSIWNITKHGGLIFGSCVDFFYEEKIYSINREKFEDETKKFTVLMGDFLNLMSRIR